ncbi:MAG: hypothetical protein Q9174_001772 [Haloplaca sp. 1 TL-2023]
MDHILTRIVHRISLGCDEWLERAADHEHGRRDKWGRKNQYWHEHEYEKQRRAEKRRARKKEKDKGDGKGKEEGKSVEAMMAGALRGGDSRDGSGTTAVGSGGSRAAAEPSPKAVGANEEPGPPAGGAASRDISPMPSEHSISSIRARTEAEAAAKAKAQANAERENPPLAIDSEDEDAKSSDDDSSDEEDEAVKAAKKGKGPATVPEAGEPSGIRGGGAETEDDDDDNEEYCEAEDFDQEYHSAVPLEDESSPPEIYKEAEAGPSSRIPLTRERRPYIVRGSKLPETEDIADRQDEHVPQRSRRPYHCQEIVPDEAATEPEPSRKEKPQHGARTEHSHRKSPLKQAGPSEPNMKAKRAANPDRERWARSAAHQHVHEQHGHTERPQRARGAKFPGAPRAASYQPSAFARKLPCKICRKDYNAHRFLDHDWTHLSPKRDPESKSTSSEVSSVSSETESEGIPESCRNWRYVKTPESSRKAESSKGHKSRRKVDSSSDDSPSASEPSRKHKSKGKGKGKGRGNARAEEDNTPPPQYDSSLTPQNHYAALGLREDATTDQIKNAARMLRIQTHPDRLVKPGMSEKDISIITRRSMRVGEAADVLCDEDKKDEYDDEIWRWKKGHGGVLPKDPEIS